MLDLYRFHATPTIIVKIRETDSNSQLQTFHFILVDTLQLQTMSSFRKRKCLGKFIFQCLNIAGILLQPGRRDTEKCVQRDTNSELLHFYYQALELDRKGTHLAWTGTYEINHRQLLPLYVSCNVPLQWKKMWKMQKECDLGTRICRAFL